MARWNLAGRFDDPQILQEEQDIQLGNVFYFNHSMEHTDAYWETIAITKITPIPDGATILRYTVISCIQENRQQVDGITEIDSEEFLTNLPVTPTPAPAPPLTVADVGPGPLSSIGRPTSVSSEILADIVIQLAADQLDAQCDDETSIMKMIQDAVNIDRSSKNQSALNLSYAALANAMSILNVAITRTLKADAGTSTAARQVSVADWRNRISNMAMLLTLKFGPREGVADVQAFANPIRAQLICNYDETTHVLRFGRNGGLMSHYVANELAMQKIKAKISKGTGGMPVRVKLGVLGEKHFFVLF
jgi:hypothetical protein